MTLGTVLLILFILLLVGALPTWPHSREWGYVPSGGVGLVLLVLLILVLMGGSRPEPNQAPLLVDPTCRVELGRMSFVGRVPSRPHLGG